MRILVLGLIVVSGLLAGASGRSSAQVESASIWIEPSAVSVMTTESLMVDIVGDIPAPGVAVWWLDLRYDPGVLFVDHCVPPQEVPTAGFCHSTDTLGTVRVWGEVEAGLVGRFKLARLPFTAIGPAGSHADIAITSVKFVDAVGNSLPVETIGGSVNVDGKGSNSLITGVVFNDANGNGVRDDGEDGIPRHVEAVTDPFPLSGSSKFDGAYLIIAHLSPANYTVEAFLNDWVPGGCLDGPGSFDPLWRVGCIPGVEVEWEATTLQPVAISVEPGSVARVDFGGRRRDQQLVRGEALLAGDVAPDGTPIRAWVGDTLCGEVQALKAGSNLNFSIQVMGEREHARCAADGDTVSFTVGKLAASQTLVWDSGLPSAMLDLIAMPDHAWFWVEQPAPADPGSVGTLVEARVDGKLCATTTIARTYQGFMPGPPPIGFTRLAVPSDVLVPGCGAPGKAVSFRIGGEVSEFTTTWEPGLHRIDLPLPGMGKTGDDDCNGVIDVQDALGILRRIVGLRTAVPCRIPVDVDCDGWQSAIDALHILRFVAGLPSRVPEGCPGVGA